MHYFEYQGEDLYCEEVPLARVAEKVGTPCYVYSHRTLVRHFRVFDNAFADLPHLICYSVKANSNLAILRLFFQMGGGADILSGGELFRVLKAGGNPGKVVCSGVGKTEQEIMFALRTGILMFNVESSQELELIDRIAGQMGKRASISLRVNPDVDPKTHPYISTGLKTNKFGIDIRDSLDEYRRARRLANIDVIGVDCHIGSQITEIGPFMETLSRLSALVEQLRSEGFDIRFLDMGGGLGITYLDETPPQPQEYARAIIDRVSSLGLTMIFEPGRVIVGNSAILLTKVLFTKKGVSKRFVVVDAGMNDLVRPSLYDSYHHIQPVRRVSRHKDIVDVVGPVCESGDFLARDRQLPEVRPGELLAVMSAGAYGFSMSSNYNSRPRPAEVMIRGEEIHIIRPREEYEDLVRGEHIPDFLVAEDPEY
ncbi:MAG: diaminopimelate decarboxylase [Deltaproteobacteria bacterium]|nr:diaminopimelate decarboxylase [Deltaproteobacteria bacterium]